MSLDSYVSKHFPALHAFLERNAHHLPALALVWGIIWDSLTLSRPDRIFDNAVMLAYIFLAGLCILLVHMRGASVGIGRVPILVIMQFAFGNLASSLFVLYGKSGTIAGNAIFFAILGAFLIGNEFLRRRYEQVHFHIAAYYLLVLAYSSLVIPVILEEIGPRAFVISVITSFVFIAGFVALLSILITKLLWQQLSDIALWIGGVAFLFSGLYAYNIIPPVPLALTHVGMYHSVLREGEGYRVTFEKPLWFLPWHDTSSTYRRVGSEGAYCFSAVYAPRKLSTPIFHVWERYSTDTNEWVETARISFSISGGRAEGYRGYSVKTRLTPGTWRCSVEVERGGVLGRFKFDVIDALEREVIEAHI